MSGRGALGEESRGCPAMWAWMTSDLFTFPVAGTKPAVCFDGGPGGRSRVELQNTGLGANRSLYKSLQLM